MQILQNDLFYDNLLEKIQIQMEMMSLHSTTGLCKVFDILSKLGLCINYNTTCEIETNQVKKEQHCEKSIQIRSFFWSVFSCIRAEYGDLRCKSSYSVRIQENMGQRKFRIWTLSTRCKSWQIFHQPYHYWLQHQQIKTL